MSEFELRTTMRKLWTEHVAWTRFYIIEAVANSPETMDTANRLLMNQDEIGAAIVPFYGRQAGAELTKLLRAHINGAAAVLKAAMSGNAADVTQAKDAWYANADEIAMFLAKANPHWPLAAMQEMMRVHLDETLVEATSRLEGKWTDDVHAYDSIVDHILAMADMFAIGIHEQFPKLVAADDGVKDDETVHLSMRKLWEDHVTWTRIVIIDAEAPGAGLPDTSTAVARLMDNQVALGDAIKPFYGEAAGDQLTSLLHQHIALAIDVVLDAKTGDGRGLADDESRWYENADAIAHFLSKADSKLPLRTAETMMRVHLDETLAEASDHLKGDFQGDIKAYDAVVDHILMMSDGISDAIVRQFGEKHR